MKKKFLLVITILITALVSSVTYAELIIKDYIFNMNAQYASNEQTLNVDVSFDKLYDEFIMPGYEHYLKSGTLYVGIYDNDSLVALDSEYIGERKISEHKAFMSFPARLLVKDKTYQIRGFIWDDDMEPIGDCKEIEYTHITESFTVERDVKLFDGFSDNILKIRNTEYGIAVNEYKLSDNYELYVNGVLLNAADLDFENLFAGADGNVRLIDTDVNGEYDKIYIDEFYYTAVVSHVVTSLYETKIHFKKSSGIAESMMLYKNGRYKYTFIKNGEEILPSELKENDVLSIKYDLNDGFDRSAFYDVQVSDKKVTGIVSRISTDLNDEKYYRIDGVDYSVAIGFTDEIVVGKSYSFFITFNNKIGYVVDIDS